jgi:hypothetical protein
MNIMLGNHDDALHQCATAAENCEVAKDKSSIFISLSHLWNQPFNSIFTLGYLSLVAKCPAKWEVTV